MPSSHAYRLCPQAIFVKPRFEAYQEASTTIRKIFADYTELFEPLSLDEAYLDVSEAGLHQGSAMLIARDITGQRLDRKLSLLRQPACLIINSSLKLPRT